MASGIKKMEPTKGILEEVRGDLNGAEPGEGPPKKKRGRKPLSSYTAEELEAREEKKREREAEKAKELSRQHWEKAARPALYTLSGMISSKWPGAGPGQDEIEGALPSVAWLLDYYMPAETELTVHWTAVIMAIFVPTGVRVYHAEKLRRLQEGGGIEPVRPEPDNEEEKEG